MKLRELLNFSDIVIQCHDNPDPDTIASGFGIFRYLMKNGKKPLLFYSGSGKIRKANMVIMTERLGIPIEYLPEIGRIPELLITVDCTYGEGNVKWFEAENVAVIDHHKSTHLLPAMHEVRSSYGSCSTLVYRLLADEGEDINGDITLATALYYGLYMDTNAMAEIGHPADKDLRDNADYDKRLMMILKNSNLASWEMRIAGDALTNCRYIPEHHMAEAFAEPCDPNLLGFISDILIQVDSVDSCVVFSENAAGYKLSVRSCTDDTDASEFVRYITKDIGSGGGHGCKAGGYISGNFVNGTDVRKFILDKMLSYGESVTVLHAGSEHIDTSDMKIYKKRSIVIGWVPSGEIAPAGTEIFIRMLEGDISVKSDPDTYLMVGLAGEVYPIKRESFNERYTVCEELPDTDYEYSPTVIHGTDNTRKPLEKYIKGCRARKDSEVMARRLDGYAKVYSDWKQDGYLYGEPGDYLVVRADDDTDFYIVRRAVFERAYATE